MLRLLLLVGFAFTLVGCVPVGSDKPLFHPARSAAGAVVLRTGVWAMPNDKCSYDPAQPARDWPSCANAMVVSGRAITGGFAEKKIQTLAYVLSPGEPLVVQLEAPADRKPEEPAYVYAGLRPLKSDDAGRIVEARIWLAVCFLPPTDLKSDKPPRLFPGLKMRKGDGFCRAAAPGPVRNAARLSEDIGVQGETFGLVARWMRDGEG